MCGEPSLNSLAQVADVVMCVMEWLLNEIKLIGIVGLDLTAGLNTLEFPSTFECV